MLCACSGEQFKFEEAPPSPVSLATRDFSVSGLSSRTTGEWDSKLEDIQGNFDAALQVFQGIDIRGLKAKMIRAIIGRSQPPRKPRSSKGEISPPTTLMSMHSVTLLLEALFLKAKSLEELGLFTGTSLEAQELYREALISFSMSLSIEPDYVPSLVSTAAVLMKLGGESIPIARSFLMNALRLDPTNHEAWMNLGLISKQQGSLKQAADCFQAAYELKLSAPVESFILDDQVK
ncbi:Protein NPGR1 [Linum perenne]